ncbi:MAG: hypothetical protein Q8N03_14420 [Ignavibacteria bacterium]|nr:hypothetical protein [Ignavibacteria bacterium]
MKKNLYLIIIATLFSIIIWVSISLSSEYFTNLKVPIKIINIPENYGIASNIPEHITLRIKGRGWKLFGMNFGSDYEYLVSAENKSGKIPIRLSNSAAENTWLNYEIQIMDFAPTSIELMIEKLAIKKVKVISILEIECRDGFGLASDIRLLPDSVSITGAESILAGIDAVSTEFAKFNNLETKLSEYVNLKSIQQVSFNKNSVRLDFDVQKIVEKEFNNLEVKVIDIPTDRDVLLLPNLITASLRGGINLISKTDQSEIKFFITYSDLVADTLGSMAPSYELPAHTQLVYTKPDRIRYIIKKY